MVRAPFFYFENVVSSRSAWSTIQRHFHGIDPEFVDSKYFSCAKRERGYVHNLPIEGRELIISEPPLTIKDAFLDKSPYWPLWDTRKKLECITKICLFTKFVSFARIKRNIHCPISRSISAYFLVVWAPWTTSSPSLSLTNKGHYLHPCKCFHNCTNLSILDQLMPEIF